ncbi:MAG: hypothetical protein Q4G64_07155 [bacterium]|nr:hypothetical protein [bacterium]
MTAPAPSNNQLDQATELLTEHASPKECRLIAVRLSEFLGISAGPNCRLIQVGVLGRSLEFPATAIVSGASFAEASVHAVLVLKSGRLRGDHNYCPSGRHSGYSNLLICTPPGCGFEADVSGATFVYVARSWYFERSMAWKDQDTNAETFTRATALHPVIRDTIAAVSRWTPLPVESLIEELNATGLAPAQQAARLLGQSLAR